MSAGIAAAWCGPSRRKNQLTARILRGPQTLKRDELVARMGLHMLNLGENKVKGESDRPTCPGCEELRERYEQLLAIFKASYDEIFVTDGDGIVVAVNEACQRLYGLKPSDMLGRSVFELESMGIFSPSTTRTVLGERRRVTVLQTTQAGKKVVVTSNPVFDADGKIKLVVSNARDVTEILDLKQQLAELESLLEAYRSEIEELRAKEARIGSLVTRSDAMREVIRFANKAAPTDATVLITGESGVGKEVLARYIQSMSSRKDGPFMKINCGAIPENLLESELFGYEPGAFTGAQKTGKPGLIELSHNGTLFLDEISELPLHLQVKLLEVIQDRQVRRLGGTKSHRIDMRIICATNKSLEELVRQGKFRDDLYYRINVVRIHVPPLRERPEDILPLCLHFLEECSKKYGVKRRLSPDALDALLTYDWPGNVRELQNVVESLSITAEKKVISLTDLPERFRKNCRTEDAVKPVTVRGVLRLSEAKAELEKTLLLRAYKTFGSTRQAARALGINQSTVVRKLKAYLKDNESRA